MRKQYEAILVGANTLREDNPRLTSRLQEHCSPLRIVLSKSGNLPLDSHLFTDEFSHKTIVALSEPNEELKCSKRTLSL
jgi:diaminohydroxyphosphoribosylaminopyrimidine deaminase/5-amino-6-(5-phosphoribosylamino)uracil reductase